MISILVAYTKKDRIIGKGGIIPWNLPSERTRFKSICQNRFIIMGRKSFDEIGHGLPYCTIIIISKTLKNAPEGCLLAKNLQNGIKMAIKYSNCDENVQNNEILIAGGGEIYKQALELPETSRVYATEIDQNYDGDVTFPSLEKYGKWKATYEEDKNELGIPYKYITYEKEF